MALDGIMMSLIKKELEEGLDGARINQIYQPSKDEIMILFRTKTDNKKLLISARADSSRVHFTSFATENPPVPPMLCMLLRKRLCGAKLIGIRQPGFERILFFDFEATNEIGDREKLCLCVEIMGRYSNIILTDENDLVIDAVRRVDMTMNSERVILPKIKYELPAGQNKMSITDCSSSDIAQTIMNSEKPLDKAILSAVQGLSPIVCREMEYNITQSREDAYTSLVNELDRLRLIVVGDTFVPTMIKRDAHTVADISFCDIKQYGDVMKTSHFESFGELLDSFYYERDMAVRMKSKSRDLHNLVNNLIERLSKKINLQKAELQKCADRETLRINGDLIQANLYRISRGDSYVDVENFYEENSPIVRIRLDSAITPAQNAQKLYKAYAKAKTREKMLTQQIEIAGAELAYLLTVQDFLNRAESDKDLTGIRIELTEQGYIKERKGAKPKNLKALPPIEYKTSDGFTVYVGRNNKQNDQLTLRLASKSDIWLHTKEIPGSHTIIVTNGKEVSDTAISQAAQICAYHSKAKNSSQVPVDYTIVKNVSKPQGAKPGKVIYVNYKTVYVTPKLIESTD